VKFRRLLPIHRAQCVERAERIARAGLHDYRRDIAATGLPDRDKVQHFVLLRTHFVKIHLVLMALERRGIGVGIKLVVHFEERARRDLRVRRSAKVPGWPAEKIAALDDLHLQRGGIGKDRPLDAVIQDFAGAEWHRDFRAGDFADG
jgi:hypothetical protein